MQLLDLQNQPTIQDDLTRRYPIKEKIVATSNPSSDRKAYQFETDCINFLVNQKDHFDLSLIHI